MAGGSTQDVLPDAATEDVQPAGAGDGRTAARRPVALVAVGAVALVQVLLVLVFAWSASRAAPHDVPIVVAGPPQATAAVVSGLAATEPGAFAVTVVPDAGAARAAVTGRDAYAALVLEQSGAVLYTASAASPAVAAALSQAVPQALAAATPPVSTTVTDLVPSPADDPHGAGLSTALIPLAITSIAAGAVIGLLGRGRRQRLVALGTYALLAGALTTWAMTALGVLTGSWLANACVVALASLAIAAATAGLGVLLGAGGVVLSLVVVFLVGFPFSGVTSAWQLVPTPWGQIAQYLPVGATSTAVRSVAFFDGAQATAPLLVLTTWATVGLVLVALRDRAPVRH